MGKLRADAGLSIADRAKARLLIGDRRHVRRFDHVDAATIGSSDVIPVRQDRQNVEAQRRLQDSDAPMSYDTVSGSCLTNLPLGMHTHAVFDSSPMQ
eukprot:SAG31_NODE_2071_length_6515_cov_2.490804_3_plen_97_part_00